MDPKNEIVSCEYGYAGCQYYKDGICTYNSSPIQFEFAKACYSDILLDRIDCEADYELNRM